MDPDAEVQGEIYLAVQMLEDVRGRCLRCHVLKARYGRGVGCRRRSENEQGPATKGQTLRMARHEEGGVLVKL